MYVSKLLFLSYVFSLAPGINDSAWDAISHKMFKRSKTHLRLAIWTETIYGT